MKWNRLLSSLIFLIGIAQGIAQERSPFITLDEIRNYNRYWVVSSFYRDSDEVLGRYYQLREDKWPAQILQIAEEGYEPIYYIIYDKARNRLRALVYQIYVKDFYNHPARIVQTERLIVQTEREYQRLKRKKTPVPPPDTSEKISASTSDSAADTAARNGDAESLAESRSNESDTSPPAIRQSSQSQSGENKSEVPPSHHAASGNVSASETTTNTGDTKPAPPSVPPMKETARANTTSMDRAEEEIRREHEREAQLPPPARTLKPSYPTAPYYVIVGSFRNVVNAQRLAGILQQDGIPVSILKAPRIGYYRVAIYPSFSNIKAREKLRKAREDLIDQAWLLINK